MADIPSTPADGNYKVVWVPTLADPDAPTSTEVTGASVVDLSCYLTADGWTPGLSEQVIADERLCSTETFEQMGRAARTLSVRYIVNPTDTTNNKAAETLVPGTAGYLITRSGKAFDTALAAADKAWVWPVTPGQYSELPPEANSVLKQEQKMFVRARVRPNVAVAA